MIEEVHQLEKEEQNEVSYPYEWAGTTIPLALLTFGAIGFLFVRLRRLERRLRQHEKDAEWSEEAAIPLNQIPRNQDKVAPTQISASVR